MRAGLIAVALTLAATGGLLSRPMNATMPGDDGTPPSTQHSTTLADQADLSVTVYNSDIALVRDVRNLRLPDGTFDLQFMDIAATVNPGDGPLPVADPARRARRARAELRVRPARTRQAAAQVRRPRRDAGARAPGRRVDARGGSPRAAPQLQQRTGVADRQRDRHRPARRSHPLPRVARQPAQPSDADLDAAESGRAPPPRRSVVPRRQAGVERRLRADRRPRRQGRRSRRLGDAHQRQRHGVQQREAAARRRRSEPRSPGARTAHGRQHEGRRVAAAAPQMAQEAFSDYHLYTLGRRTTINNNETKQVSMLSGTGVPTLKRYVVNGQAYYYRNAHFPGAPIKDVVQVFYQFKNEQKGGLGMPMPAGHDPRLPGRLEGRHPLRRRGPHRPHPEGRDASTSRSATPSTSSASGSRPTSARSRRTSTSSSTRSRCATTRATAISRRGERTDRRHLGHAARLAQVDQDRRVGLAVRGAGGRRGERGREVPGPRDLLIAARDEGARGWGLRGWGLGENGAGDRRGLTPPSRLDASRLFRVGARLSLDHQLWIAFASPLRHTSK